MWLLTKTLCHFIFQVESYAYSKHNALVRLNNLFLSRPIQVIQTIEKMACRFLVHYYF